MCYIAFSGLVIAVYSFAIRQKVIEAARDGTVEEVKYFIERGVSVHVKDRDGTPLIHHAVFNPNIEVMKYLVEQGADVNATNNSCITPLDYAIITDDKERETILRESGGKCCHECQE